MKAMIKRAAQHSSFYTSLLIIVLFVVWQVGTQIGQVSVNILPPPTSVFRYANWTAIWAALSQTALATVGGFIVGNVLGVLLASLIVSSQLLTAIIYPIAFVVRSLPVVAIAPFITLVLNRGPQTTLVIAAIIVFFPTMMNMTQALQSTPKESVEMARVFNVSSLRRFFAIKFPYAQPALFSSLRIAAPNAVLGVMTGEWVIGNGGLGYLVTHSSLTLDMPTMWVCTLLSTLLAFVFFAIVAFVEHRTIAWALLT
jgi:NitT/TauT family transport system permease protein